jgi:hypothetical protein
MKILAPLWQHRTKVMGYAGAGIGAAQATWAIVQGQPFKQSLITMTLGVGTAVIGHYNSSIINSQNQGTPPA